jgi:NAD(P)-dependent dehydrogenase (short-subunit alcohol dehydrogenase family)
MSFPAQPSFDLTGKRTLVTEASKGIRLNCTVVVAEHGAKVTLAAQPGDKPRNIADELTAENGMSQMSRQRR